MPWLLFVCKNIQYIVPLVYELWAWIREQANSDDPDKEFKNFLQALRDGRKTKDPSAIESFFRRVR